MPHELIEHLIRENNRVLERRLGVIQQDEDLLPMMKYRETD